MNALRPFFICALGVFLGTALDAMVKAIAADLPVLTLTAWRFVFGSVLIVPVYLARGGRLPGVKALRFHALRGAVHAIAVTSFFGALSLLPLAMVTVMGFTAALMVAPMARLILGEPMPKVVILAALLGFGGVVLTATGFEGEAIDKDSRVLGVGLVMISAVTYAATLVLIRLRTRTETALTIVMFSNVYPALFIFAGLVLAALFLPEGPQVWPGVETLPALILIAVIGVAVWLLMTFAYARTEAARLAPIEYTALVWSALLGAVFFGEVPGLRLYAGAAIIIGACLLVAFETHFRARREAGLPASDILE